MKAVAADCTERTNSSPAALTMTWHPGPRGHPVTQPKFLAGPEMDQLNRPMFERHSVTANDLLEHKASGTHRFPNPVSNF